MKKFILLIIIISSIPLISYGQDINWKKVPPEVRKNFFIALTKLDSCYSIIQKDDSIITGLQMEVKKDDSVVIEKSNQMKILQQEKAELIAELGAKIILPPEIPKLFQWDGFYVGLNSYYNFADSSITSNSFLQKIQYGIFGEANIKISNNFKISPELLIPFKEEVRVNIKLGYRIF
jgi:hypothetical protein